MKVVAPMKFFVSKLKVFTKFYSFYKIHRSWVDWMTNLLLILNCFLHENYIESYFVIKFCAKSISIVLDIKFAAR